MPSIALCTSGPESGRESDRLGVLGSNPSSVQLLKIQSPTLPFPTCGQEVCEGLGPAIGEWHWEEQGRTSSSLPSGGSCPLLGSGQIMGDGQPASLPCNSQSGDSAKNEV